MDEQLTVKAVYVDEVSRGIVKTEKQVSTSSNQMAAATGAMSSAFSKLGVALGGLFVFQRVAAYMKEAVYAADGAAKSEAQLAQALGKTSTALLSQAEALSKITLFKDDEIVQAQAMIAAYVKEEDQIKKLMPVIQDFATAKKIDLASAADLVGRTIGTGANALSRYGVQLKNVNTVSERAKTVTEALTRSFGGQAEAAAKAGAGPLTLFLNMIDKMNESIGKLLLPTINLFVSAASSGFDVFGGAVRMAIGGVLGTFQLIALGVNSLLVLPIIYALDTIVAALEWTVGKVRDLAFTLVEKGGKLGEFAKPILGPLVEIENKLIAIHAKTTDWGIASANATKAIAGAFAETSRQTFGMGAPAVAGPGGPGAAPLPTVEDEKKKNDYMLGLVADFQDSKIALIEDAYDREAALLEADTKRKLEKYKEDADARYWITADFENKREKLIRDKAKAERELNLQTTGQIVGNFLELANMFKDSSEDMFRMAKGFAIAQAVINTAEAFTKALTAGPILGPILGASIAALGGAQVAMIANTKFKAAAKGADYVTSGPEMLMVGDNPGGRERVRVTPLGQGQGPGSGVMIDARITINGNTDASTVAALRTGRAEQLENIKSALRELQYQGQIEKILL